MNTTTAKTAMRDVVTATLQENDFKFVTHDDGRYCVPVSDKNGSWLVWITVREEINLVMVISNAQVKVPESKRLMMIDYLNRVNFGLTVGNFEMNPENGEIAMRTSMEVSNATLTGALVFNILFLNLMCMDKIIPGIMAIVYGSATPTEAKDLVFKPQT